MKICVTGHHPSKLSSECGYDYNSVKCKRLKNIFKEFIKQKHVTCVYTGMALGVDTVMVLAVIELRYEGYPVKLICVLPCAEQSSMWIDSSKKLYYGILSIADGIYGITEESPYIVELVLRNIDNITKLFIKCEQVIEYPTTYRKKLMSDKNRFLVDSTDSVVSVWDDTFSGTGHCVNYALSRGKTVVNFKPDEV